MSVINQKEYLKKYLGLGKKTGEKKKKKKAKKIAGNGLKIVDDDIDVNLNQEIKEDLAADNEDAPQIVSIIDDRPPSLRIDEATHDHLWQPIGGADMSSSNANLKFEGIKLSITSESSKSLPKKVKSGSNIKDSEFRVPKNDYYSPPRKSQKRNSPDNSPPRKHSSEDNSPPRRRNNDQDSSPPRKHRLQDSSPPRRKNNSDDSSSSRKIKRERSIDNSPPRRHKKESLPQRRTKINEDHLPPRKIQRENIEDNSPPRKSKEKKSRWADNEIEDGKLKKTLDGKTAGLQNAKNLVLETQELKKREDILFQNMSADVSGANAATIVRSKKKEVDWEEEECRRKKDEENKEKYNKWGKGLKQVQDINEKIQNDLYEMSKPLARYADDEDLEKYLKEQERDGDPMLAYIRQKKKKKSMQEGKPITQEYQGDAPPNRFGIRPGYRWDGVNRSNGYEKEWFQVQNSRQANIVESYKWSTEDM